VSGIDHPFRKALEIPLGPDVSSVNCLLWQMHFLFQNGQANHYSTEPKLCLRASYDLSGMPSFRRATPQSRDVAMSLSRAPTVLSKL
jgi:hypothetical protein